MEDGDQKKLTPQLPTAGSQLLFRRGPALFHQRQQMFQRRLVAAAFFGGELAGAFVELRGHGGGLLRRAAERDEDLGKFGNFHAGILAAPGRG